jgi:hypothetical protein
MPDWRYGLRSASGRADGDPGFAHRGILTANDIGTCSRVSPFRI